MLKALIKKLTSKKAISFSHQPMMQAALVLSPSSCMAKPAGRMALMNKHSKRSLLIKRAALI